MASTLINRKLCFSVVAVLYMCVLCCRPGNAEEEGVPQLGEGGEADEPGIGIGGEDGYHYGYHNPPQIVAKALLCFSEDHIYKNCEESYRLDQSGDLHVPPEHTLAYCTGPCLTETNLVLDCIDGILADFLFYNRATIKAVRDTIHAGCSYGPERGHFDVAEHIAAEEDGASRVPTRILTQLILVLLGRLLLLGHV